MIKRKGRGGTVETLHADDVAMSPSSSRPRLYMLYDNASAVLSHVAILLSCTDLEKKTSKKKKNLLLLVHLPKYLSVARIYQILI